MKKTTILIAMILQIIPFSVALAGEHTLTVINFTKKSIRSISISDAEIIDFKKIKRKSEGYVKFSIPKSKCLARVRINFSGGGKATTRRNVCNGGTMTVYTTK